MGSAINNSYGREGIPLFLFDKFSDNKSILTHSGNSKNIEKYMIPFGHILSYLNICLCFIYWNIFLILIHNFKYITKVIFYIPCYFCLTCNAHMN